MNAFEVASSERRPAFRASTFQRKSFTSYLRPTREYKVTKLEAMEISNDPIV